MRNRVSDMLENKDTSIITLCRTGFRNVGAGNRLEVY
jgi:hypothetical protein